MNEDDQIEDDSVNYSEDYNVDDDIMDDWDNLGTGNIPSNTDDAPDEVPNDSEDKDTQDEIKDKELDSDGDDTPVEDESLELVNLVDEDDPKFNEQLVQSVEALVMSGNLLLDDEQIVELFDGTDEGYDKLMAANSNAVNTKAIETIYSSIPQKGHDFLKYLMETEGDADIDGFLQLEKARYEYEGIDLDSITEEQAREVIKAAESEKGTKPKMLTAYLNALEDDGEIIDAAKELVGNKLQSIEQAKADKLAADKAIRANNEAKAAEEYNNTLSAINATGFAKTKQAEIYDMIYKTDESNKSPIITLINNAFQNPNHLIQLVTLFDGYTEEEGFSLTRFKKQAETKAIERTRRKIRRSSAPSNTGSGSVQPNKQGREWMPTDADLGI